MKYSWSQQIARARQLGQGDGHTAGLLASYADVLAIQQAAFDAFRANGPLSGSLEGDLSLVRDQLPPLLHSIANNGPSGLAVEANELLQDNGGFATDQMLLTHWHSPSDQNFFGKAALQPYASCLAESGVDPVGRQMTRAENRCPFCSGRPQLAILTGARGADGAGRQLQCATCLTIWPFERIVCVYCGEEDERKTGYFHTPAFDHLRIDACESCKHYLKTVDLTKLPLAVPLVDEVAGAPLDLWAREQGYEKIELNLMGL